MTVAQRRLGIALLAAVSAVLFWLAPDADIPEPAGSAGGAPAPDSSPLAGQLPALREWPVKVPAEPLPEPETQAAKAVRETGAEAGGLAVKSSEAVPGAPAASKPPSPPALPFRYIGRLAAGETHTVFLAARGNTLSVEAGATLDDGWRLDAILADRLEFTHLPTDTRQSLNIAAP